MSEATNNTMQFFAYHAAPGATREEIAQTVFQYFDEESISDAMINDSIDPVEVAKDLKSNFSQLHGVEDVPEEFRDMASDAEDDEGDGEVQSDHPAHELFDGNGIAIHIVANLCTVNIPFMLNRWEAQSTLGLARDIFARLKHHHGYLLFDVRSREVVTELDWEGAEGWSSLT